MKYSKTYKIVWINRNKSYLCNQILDLIDINFKAVISMFKEQNDYDESDLGGQDDRVSNRTLTEKETIQEKQNPEVENTITHNL